MNTDHKVEMINVENVIPNRFQPRLTFDEESLNELSASIKEHGIIQPLVLRKLGEKYEIVAGERRYKAATIAGLTEIPAIISNLDDNRSAEVALVENVQRKNLTSIEEAKSYKKILEKGYLTQQELSKKMGITQSTIANKLRLLNLTEEVQEALLNERISERHARSLLQIEDQPKQVELLNKVINERLTVRQLDTLIKDLPQDAKPEIIFDDTKQEEEEEIDDIEIIEEEEKEESPLEPNIENIKEQAEDIIPNSNSNILSMFSKTAYNSLEDEAVNLSIDNIFDDYSEEKDEILDVPDFTPSAPVIVREEDEEDKIKRNNLPTVINAYHKLEEEVKINGYKITSEEFDFEDLYQIIIKIEK